MHHVLCGALLLGTASQNPVAAQASRSDTPPVEVYFTVRGKGNSSPVPDLSQLSVSLDKQPALASSLRSANGDKLLFALLVDISGSGAAVAPEIKQAALQLFQGLLAEGAMGDLVVFNTKIEMSKAPVNLVEVQKN